MAAPLEQIATRLVKEAEGVAMMILALTAAILLDASPTIDRLPKGEKTVAAQHDAPAPLLTVAVTLECTARAAGRVEDCRVLGETHPGLGFGEAAIALMRDAQVEPGRKDYQFARTIQFTP